MTISKEINIFIITDESTKKELEHLIEEIKKPENEFGKKLRKIVKK